MKFVQFFPTVMIVLDLCASAVYLQHNDLRHTIYWIAAAVLTTCVTY